MHEMEYKYMLNESQYMHIMSRVHSEQGNIDCKIQVNYYYDSNNYLLDNNKITLRVRQKDSKLSLELKSELQNEGLLRINEELEYPIDKLPLVLNRKKVSWLECLPDSEEISLKGSLITERITVKPCEGIKLDIDKSIYLGKVDYELEVEFKEELKEKAYELLRDYTNNIEVEVCQGKRGRFFSQLKKLSEGI
jgi:uncharacterized protein YjbK